MARSMTMEFSKNHFSVLAFHSSVALRSSWEADTSKWRAWTKIKRTRKSAKESCSGWERNISAWIPQCMIRTITIWNSANSEFWTPHSDNSKDMRALLFRTMLCMLNQQTVLLKTLSRNKTYEIAERQVQSAMPLTVSCRVLLSAKYLTVYIHMAGQLSSALGARVIENEFCRTLQGGGRVRKGKWRAARL